MKHTRTSRAVLTVSMDVKGRGWEQWFLISSDRHLDNQHSDLKLQRKHLEDAEDRNAFVIDHGDLFCAMQGKWDKRADASQLRPELRGGDYLDRVVTYAADFLEPYAHRFLEITHGNHETGVLKRHETDLTARLVERLNTRLEAKKNPHRVTAGGFSGWVRFQFTFPGSRRGPDTTKLLAWHHGFGGGGPVTRGVIQTNRMAVYLPDAQLVHTGHTHDEWAVPIQRWRITNRGELYQDRQVHFRTPGYKDEFADGFGGWHIERGGPPKPIGAAWLRFYYEPTDAATMADRIRFELKSAE